MRQTKRVWKPLDVNYLRLYRVTMHFSQNPEWDQEMVVAARSPRDASKIIEAIYEKAQWADGEPEFEGRALNIYQPDYWNGAVVDPDTAIHPLFGKAKKGTK